MKYIYIYIYTVFTFGCWDNVCSDPPLVRGYRVPTGSGLVVRGWILTIA